MTIQGIDFANPRPSGKALKAAGIHFVIRYLSPNTSGNPAKRLTSGEIKDYRANGLDIGVVWETTTGRAMAGESAGVADAKAAESSRIMLGIPAIPIHFAVDEDTTGPAVAAYFEGVASVIGVARTGVYAGYRVVSWLFDHKLVAYAFQTYAWSGGRWDSRAHVEQYDNGQHVAGDDVDLCRATQANWGQWPAPGAATTYVHPAGSRTLQLATPHQVGHDVVVVQRATGAEVDGDYGPSSAGHVKTFQGAHRLTEDGIVGAHTWAALGVKYVGE